MVGIERGGCNELYGMTHRRKTQTDCKEPDVHTPREEGIRKIQSSSREEAHVELSSLSVVPDAVLGKRFGRV